MASSDVETGLDELYAAPIDDFTSTRNALAKQLGKDGAQIKTLKKPNLAAWGLNQLARKHGDELESFFATTEKLRRAQRRAMSGGTASDLRAATDERNRAAGQLTKLVERILRDAGHAAAASTLSAVRESFVAAASDELGAALLRKGRLTRELQPGAIVDVGGLTLVDDEPDDEPQPDRSSLKAARAARDEARVALKGARDALKDANREADRLEIEADQAAKAAKAAHEKADFARRAADARRGEVEDAERAVEEAEKAVEAAEN